MAKRYARRSTRPLEDMPSLFDDDTPGMAADATPHTATPPTPAGIEPLAPAYSSRPAQIQFISLGSGSSGNCAYIGTPDEGGVLIDAGVDNNRVVAELSRSGIDMARVHGIILTHDHSDHVRFAYSLLRRHPHMRLYATPKTLNGLLQRHNISRRIKDYHVAIYKEFEFTVARLRITPFDTNHDGTDNVGFCIESDGACFVVATDMGMVTPRADHYMRRARYLMLESDYDEYMLEHGNYPEYLKARIRSEHGHMSNAASAAYLARIYSPALAHIFLCHLSEHNNTPETAFAAAAAALTARGITVGDGTGSVNSRNATLQLTVLPRFDSSDLFILR